MKKTTAILPLLALLLTTAMVPARTKLVTLPDRARMVVSLENPNNTLLYEEREIPLQKGENFVDFSWNGVNIDSNSVMIELLTNPGDAATATKIIATGFPPNENALTWQLYSPEARTERIRVSYILYGIEYNSSYDLRMNKEETTGDFRQYTMLSNSSGEDLDGAVLRFAQVPDMDRSMDSGETRRFLSLKAQTPVKKLYVAKPGYFSFLGEEGEEVNLVYELKNEEANGLGKAKLPGGKARIYGDDGMDSFIFLGEDNLKDTAPKEAGELTLGKVKDVVLKRRMMKDEKTNQRYNNNQTVILYDQVRQLRYEVENFKNEPVTLKIVEPMSGDWEIKEATSDGVKTERKAIDQLEILIDLPAAPKGEAAVKKVVDISTLVKNRFPNEQ